MTQAAFFVPTILSLQNEWGTWDKFEVQFGNILRPKEPKGFVWFCSGLNPVLIKSMLLLTTVSGCYRVDTHNKRKLRIGII